MKRKDFGEDVDDAFYFPSSKSRRLDADLFATVNEDPRSAAQVFEARPSQGTIVMQTDDLRKDPLPSGDEKAIVLYNPANMPLLLKSPDSRDFSLIVSSDLIPGLRDHIYSWGNSKSLKPAEDRVIEEENEEVSNVCLAVVPWVASKLPLASRDQAASQSEPMEAEEIEMMDTDDNDYNAGEAPGFGRMMEGSGGLQHWQQQQHHWLEPKLVQNNYTPVT
ncbi:hypothetical protein CerSpe_049110 [Prunus speciosa]